MKSKKFIAGLRELIVDRFQIESECEITKALKKIAPAGFPDLDAIRVRRSKMHPPRWRTLLVAELESKSQIEKIIRWSAEARDALIEPETSDLYLMLMVPDLRPYECVRLEANEQFCRKYVVTNIAELEKMLNRTFLAQSFVATTRTKIFDPVAAAFSITRENHIWLTKEHEGHWLQALLSGNSGHDLMEELMKDPAKSGSV